MRTMKDLMSLRTVKLTSGRQIYLPEEVLEEAGVDEASRFVVRVRGGVIELVPEHVAAKVLDEGLEAMRRTSLEHLEDEWDNEEDEVWDDVEPDP